MKYWKFTVSNLSRVLLKAACALAAYALLEGLIFQTHFYTSIIEPESTAGRMELFLHNEHVRPKGAPRQVLAVGDSRMGFLPRIANEEFADRGYGFGTISLGGTTPRTWYYSLRSADPTARRYAAIVIPSSDYDEPEQWDFLDDRDLDLSYIAGQLSVRDLIPLSTSFVSFKRRWEAARATLLKGYVYRRDFEAFIAQPLVRLERVAMYKRESHKWYYGFNGEDFSLAGIAVDWNSKAIQFPPQVSTAQQDSIRQVLFPDRPPQNGRMRDYLRLWYGRILDRYKDSPTKLIFIRVPRGPAGAPPRPPNPESVARSMQNKPNVLMIPEHRYDVLENPELFGDAMHMNGPGMRAFSKMLGEDIVQLLESAR